MSEKKRIGITGGIGAGKTQVCRILNAMGYPVFYSDLESKKILNTDLSVKKQITAIFGKQAYFREELNRPFIAEKVFNNPELLAQLNAIAHPAVRSAFEKWSEEQTTRVVFNEAAILFETGIYTNYDATVLVTAPLETRLNRVIKRDKTDRKTVIKRMEKQWSDKRKRELADFEIINDDDQLLIPQVLDLLKKLGV